MKGTVPHLDRISRYFILIKLFGLNIKKQKVHVQFINEIGQCTFYVFANFNYCNVARRGTVPCRTPGLVEWWPFCWGALVAGLGE